MAQNMSKHMFHVHFLNVCFSKGNHKQNEKTTYGMGENIRKWDWTQEGIVGTSHLQLVSQKHRCSPFT